MAGESTGSPAIVERNGSRVASAFIYLLLGAGCLVLWIGIPAAGMWLAGELTDSFGLHMPLTLALVVPGMFAMATLLAWLNALHMRITGTVIERSSGLRYRNRGPLEPMMLGTLLLAIVTLFVWFFFFAENPSPQVI